MGELRVYEIENKYAGRRNRLLRKSGCETKIDIVADGCDIGDAQFIGLVATGEIEREEFWLLKSGFPERFYGFPLLVRVIELELVLNEKVTVGMSFMTFPIGSVDSEGPLAGESSNEKGFSPSFGELRELGLRRPEFWGLGLVG